MIVIAARLALLFAIVGTISTTVYLALVILGVCYLRKSSRRAANKTPDLPPVSILKPLHGMEPQLEENLRSFFEQQYSSFEILFAADEEDDPALEIVRKLSARYPDVRVRVLVTGKPRFSNPPAYSFYRMGEVAAHDILVTSDSDVSVTPEYLREISPALLDPSVGMVTCVYRGVSTRGFWSLMDALGMSVEMTAGVLVANLLEGMKFGLGPTIAVRKDSIEKIGGFQAVGEYFSNDFMIGNLIEKVGYRVLLSNHPVTHVVPTMTARQMWNRQVRWAVGTRYSRPKGHPGTLMTFAMPFGILGLLAGACAGYLALGLWLFGIALANRMIESAVVGGVVVHDSRAVRFAWLYPLRDFLGFLVWCASYCNSKAVWRGKNFTLTKDGKIALRQVIRANDPPGTMP